MSEQINIANVKYLTELDLSEIGDLNPSTRILTVLPNGESKLLRYGYINEDVNTQMSLVSNLATSLKICNSPEDYNLLGNNQNIINKIVELQNAYKEQQ